MWWMAEDSRRCAVGDGDGGGVDEDEHGDAGVAVADAEMVHPAGSAEGDLAELVDVVEADAVVVSVVVPRGVALRVAG